MEESLKEGTGAFERVLRESLPRKIAMEESSSGKCVLFEKKIRELQERMGRVPAVRKGEEDGKEAETGKEREQEYDLSDYDTSSDEEFFSREKQA